MATAYLMIGNVFDELAKLAPNSVDLVQTSPPFWGLRSYLDDDDPMKAFEIGAEPTPGAYLDTMLRVVAAASGPLAPHGSISIEIGDSYAGSGGAGGDYNPGGFRDGQQGFVGSAARGRVAGDALPLDKSLCMIPTLFAASLAYGVNLLTGRPSPAGRWIVRNVVVWARPNPAVGELFDKFRPSTSYMTIATRAKDRYFDLDAVRVPNISKADPSIIGRVDQREAARAAVGLSSGNGFTGVNDGGTPPNDYWTPWPVEQGLWDAWADEVWNISTRPYKGSHYAVYPPALCVRPIKTMCPERVCRTCGLPSRRIVDHKREFSNVTETSGRQKGAKQDGALGADYEVTRETIGWSDCGHDDWRPGMVLDPFGGSGTTAAVATGHGRDCTLVDLDARNEDLCRERIGLFLEVVERLRDVPPRPVDEVDDSTAAML